MIYAVVPSAGKSSRMGRPKLSLPFGARTVIEQVVASLRDAGIEHILVVVGPQDHTLATLAATAGAQVHRLARETPDMRATIAAGLAWIDDHFHPVGQDSWLLVPADHPTLSPAIVRQLIQAQYANPARSIFVPIHGGRRGHPTLLAWQHAVGIRQYPVNAGLNAYIREQTAMTLEVPTESADILRDLDTPTDYEQLCERVNDASQPA